MGVESVALDGERLGRVQRLLLDWYARHARPLPWRDTRDPYAVLVSEIMLQQTQVERVVPRWRAWLEQFPTLSSLATASRAEVIKAWSGLGYNLRAVRLHEIARQAVERFGGTLPGTLEELLALKGLGPYTAGAVACFAFEQPVAVVDTNIRRVLGRALLGEPHLERASDRAARALADAALRPDSAYAWNQALMDLGATLCTVHRPACIVCPLVDACAAAPLMGSWPEERRRRLAERRAAYDAPRRRNSDAQRFYRGRVIEALRSLPPGGTVALAELGPRVRDDFGPDHHGWLEATVRKLAADGLVELDGADRRDLLVRLPESAA